MNHACATAKPDDSLTQPHAAGWVLVVEDDADLRGLVGLSIQEVTGLEVKLAGDGAQALELLAHSEPALVITDLMMPRVDGHQLYAWLRDQYPGLPVVAMSAAESKSRALAAGFDAYLVKPFELEELCAVLARWVTVA